MVDYCFAKINNEVLNNFWKYKIEKDAIAKAITQAKHFGLTNSDIQPLVIQKLKNSQLYLQAENDIIYNAMHSNLVDFHNGWTGIICDGLGKKSKYDFVVFPFKKIDFSQIYIDISLQKNVPKVALTEYFEHNQNNKVMEKHHREVIQVSQQLLHTCFEYTIDVVKNKRKYYLTNHCVERWNERVNNKTTKIKFNDREKIANDIIQAFLQSSCVYHSVGNDTRFFLNIHQMIFFAVTNDNTIVTIWKNTYGFGDDSINRTITLMQLEYLNKQKKLLPKKLKAIDNVEGEYVDNKHVLDSKYEEMQQQCDNIDEQIKLLEEQKQNIKNEQEIIAGNIFNIDKKLEDIQKQKHEVYKYIQQEESKIFKAHKFIDVVKEEE